MLKKLVLLGFAMVLGTSLMTGCKTAHGFGEDVEDAGESLQDAVN